MARIGPGFRFHPTDEELVVFYLKRKITGNLSRYDHIAVVDVYKLEPWDLPSLSKLKTKDLEWYFFSVLDRKYGNGTRTNRATDKGYWKTTGKDRAVYQGDRIVGMKKTLVYHIGRAPHGRRTNWVMHEYKLLEEELARAGTVQDIFVLCRIFEKSGSGPKNGAKYGAPLDEKEWDEEVEEEEKKVIPLQSGENVAENVVAVARLPVAHDEVFYSEAYVETDDLDKELDFSDIIGCVNFPLFNYHHGECSTHAEHSQIFTKDQEPVANAFEIYGPENGLPLDVAEQHVVGSDSVEDERSGQMSDFENILNFDDAANDMDLDLIYMDAVEKLPLLDEGSFLETNDLTTVNEGDPVEDDPSGDAMLDEYLALPDDDVCNYISFDSPQIPEAEYSIPNQGSLFSQQDVEGETTDNAVVNKHYSEAQTSNDASSVQNKQEAKVAPGNTNSLVEQAYGWLASIPAAPAHALEFPAKEIALGLHPSAQSSSPAHITTGMISITNITFNGNAMDWTMGKSGGFNAVVSTGFSQPNVDSAALIPLSGLVSSKTAFVLSHGWIFLTGFSILILSLSCKIGSIMYTGK